MAKRKQRLLLPECASALEAMKHEIAAELGLYADYGAIINNDTEFSAEFGSLSKDRASATLDWPNMSARAAGSVGGQMTARLIAQAQRVLSV